MSSKEASFDCLRSWGNAVAAQDKPLVLSHYADSATLWPTLSNHLRESASTISDYFDLFLPKINGNVSWDNACYQPIDDTNAVWSGSYTFELANGPTQARFTYVLQKQGSDWKIRHHHSSLMPEA